MTALRAAVVLLIVSHMIVVALFARLIFTVRTLIRKQAEEDEFYEEVL